MQLAGTADTAEGSDLAAFDGRPAQRRRGPPPWRPPGCRHRQCTLAPGCAAGRAPVSLSLQDLVAGLPVNGVPTAPVTISGVQHDSRRAGAGDLYMALPRRPLRRPHVRPPGGRRRRRGGARRRRAAGAGAGAVADRAGAAGADGPARRSHLRSPRSRAGGGRGHRHQRQDDRHLSRRADPRGGRHGPPAVWARSPTASATWSWWRRAPRRRRPTSSGCCARCATAAPPRR